MILRAMIFLAVFGALQFTWQLLDGSALYHLLIDQGVVVPAAVLGRALTPDLGVHAVANHLRDTSGGLNIINGCDGMETLFLLFAGFAVAPLRWRARLYGVLVGIAVVYTLNLVRILALFYARRRDMALFDLLHGIVTPAIMVLSIAAFYYVWLRRSDGPVTR
ncbi:MAG: archaeosortase/exosortase family protein [Steroidobacteraceae bacterium]